MSYLPLMIPCRPLRVPIRYIGGKISYWCYQINAHTALKIGNRTNCSLSQKHPTRPKLVIKTQTFCDPVHQFDILTAKPLNQYCVKFIRDPAWNQPLRPSSTAGSTAAPWGGSTRT
ncbi:hypothetical protein I7I48_02633 [Histoplasma ohiense]|nr:hypothetical protein I7I48_02633 [Histoplasma ohiense (nom. inval.)]